MNILLETIGDLRLQFAQGRAFQSAFEEILIPKTDAYSNSLKIWLKKKQAGQERTQIYKAHSELMKTPSRRALMSIFESGYSGAPIDKPLAEIQNELYQLIEHELEKRLQTLPLKMIGPLVLFVLPGVLSLIIGPLFLAFTKGF